MGVRRNLIDIQTDTKFRLQNNTPITDFSNLSTANNLTLVVSQETEKVYDEIEYLYSILDPTKTYGQELDKLGYSLGNIRASATTASDLTQTNFYFYLDPRLGIGISSLIDRIYPTATHFNVRKRMEDQGHIDDAVTPTYIRIPAGTLVSNDDGTIQYTTVDEVFFTDTDKQVGVAVVGTTEGVGQNVESNVLTKHALNEIDILRGLAKYILCSNRYPIQTGKDSVTDDEFRYNLALNRINHGSNEAAVRQAALSIPGVRNVLFERGRFGNGTFNIIIEGISPIVSEGLINAVTERVRTIVGGDQVFVHRPDYIGVELNIELIVDIGTNLSSTRDTIRTAIINFINNIPIGQTLIWKQLEGLIINNQGVNDFVTTFFKMGEYDIFNKINRNQMVLREVNQRARHNEKFYTDSGLISICVTEQG